MSNSLLYGNPYYLLLSFMTMTFAVYTAMSMVNQIRTDVKLLNYCWLLGASIIFSLGLWTMDIVSQITSTYVVVMNWSMTWAFLGSVAIMFLAVWMLRQRLFNRYLREIIAAFLIASTVIWMHYFPLLIGSIPHYTLNVPLLVLSFLINLAGGYLSLTLIRRKSAYYKLKSSLVWGFTSVAVLQISMQALKIDRNSAVTKELLGEYALLLGVILCMTTILIVIFSLTSWLSMKKYAMIDERYKYLVENSMDTIALIQDGKWEYVNPSGLTMFEAEQEELLGSSIYNLLQDRFHKEMTLWLDADPEPGMEHAKLLELEWRTLTGKLIFTEVMRVRTTLSGNPLVQVIIRDISERKRNEAIYVNAEKLSIAGQLAAGIAHEIRNPLTSLKGFMQLIASGRIHNNRYYAIMKSELSHIESIVSELLMLSKPQVYEFTRIECKQMLRETVELIESHASQHQVEIECRFHNGTMWVHGVESQLKQLFINVIRNAIESMPGGGRVQIELTEDIMNNVMIRIKDNGIGIGIEQLSKIGQPFYTTKEKGTGLGLMVSYKIVDNHNGRISAESELGSGTTFTIELPQATMKETVV
ncbi:ATP-binding protein [Paenibacillus sp. HB172176]|uniref:ATP-binding protein n=1 Tax=Paenibacillus sp. HB172176 TaxID=2493690 RepID=UPI00143C5F42|nr:ATP-binding protein [Paenibacillus sp. HB172176]